MADPTPDDDAGTEPPSDEADSKAEAPATPAPSDPTSDVEARRAATKARMDAASDAAPTRATADDPTGSRGRRRGRDKAATMGTASASDPTGTRARRGEATKEAAPTTKKVPRPSKRTGGAIDPKDARKAAARSGNPKRSSESAGEASRYTAPIPRSQLESPAWVPVIMFGLLGLGMIVIFLTYVLWEGRPLALGVGLGCILGGILAATQYR